ncbi:MAG: hypothetical protein V9G15_02665 [Dermatophilaceae bacterium]
MSGPPSAHGRASLTRHSISDKARYAVSLLAVAPLRDRRFCADGVVAVVKFVAVVDLACGRASWVSQVAGAV